MFFELGGLYEKAAEVAERALAVDPGTGYALTDLADEDTLVTLFSSPTTSMIVIQGTLQGCLAALRSVPKSSEWLRAIVGHPPVPPGLHIEPAEFDSAIEWLTRGATLGLDDAGLDQRVAEKTASWHDDLDLATRATGQVLALVTVADVVCTMGRRS